MDGMNRDTGKFIEDRAHLLQSIQMIIETPKGSRVMRPTFGSDVYKYVASPATPETDLKIYAAVIDALTQWEPRLTVDQVRAVDRDATGTLTIAIVGEYQSDEFETTIQARFE